MALTSGGAKCFSQALASTYALEKVQPMHSGPDQKLIKSCLSFKNNNRMLSPEWDCGTILVHEIESGPPVLKN